MERKRFQEGGLASANEALADPSQTLLGVFASMNQTTPEAQEWAKRYLADIEGYDWASEEEIIQKQRDVAEQSRQALIRAREEVLGTSYDKRKMWMAAAEAFGQPTRTGQFGETIGNLAGAMGEQFEARDEFTENRRGSLLDLEQALAGVDQNLLESEFGLQSLQRGQQLALGKEAAKIMGRTAARPPRQVSDLPAIKSLDQKMATEYTDWITGGQEYMLGKQALLADAIHKLRTEGGLSGQWEGLIPKMARDIFLPESSDVQEVVQTVAQESLKQILGGQFGQREGEMLLERTFNPRLDESKNAARAEALLLKIQKATDEKRRAMEWFASYGTMGGYQGNSAWSIRDFMPDPFIIKVRMDDGTVVEAEDWWSQDQVRHFHQTGERPVDPFMDYLDEQGYKKGGRVRGKRRKKFREGGRVPGFSKKPASPRYLKMQRYQAGGEVEDEDEIIDIGDVPGEGGDDFVDIEDFGDRPVGPLQAVGVPAAGAAVGVAGEEIYSRVEERRAGVERPSHAERLVGESMDRSGVEPADARAEVRRARRSWSPTVLADEAGRGTRALGVEAAIRAGTPGDEFLDMLEERHAGSRHRVGTQVERGLRTPEFTTTEQKLTDRLYERSRPLYQQAYAEGEKMTFPKKWDEWMERPYSRQAIDQAIEFMQNKGLPIGPTDATGAVRSFSLEFLDEIKRGFDQMIRTEENMGPTPKGRIMRGMRGELMGYLNKNAPEAYRLAREQYKGDLEVLEALDIGRKEFHRLPPPEIEIMLTDMDWSEKQALRTGVAQHIYDMIYGPSGDIDAARRLIGSPDMKSRLKTLFEKPSEWRIFEAALEREMKMFAADKQDTRRIDRGRTGRQVGEVLASQDPFTPVKEMMSKGPLMWVLRTVGWGRKGGGLTEQQADEIVNILRTGEDLSRLDDIIPQLERARDYSQRRRRRRGKAAAVGTAVGAAIVGVDAFGEEEPPEEVDLQTLKDLLEIEE